MPRYTSCGMRGANTELTQRVYTLERLWIAVVSVVGMRLSGFFTPPVFISSGFHTHSRLTVTTARGASSAQRTQREAITDPPVLLPITTEVISSKRDCTLLNLLINVTTTI